MVDVDASFVTSLAPVVTATTGRDRLASASFTTSLSGVAGLDLVRHRLASASFTTSLSGVAGLDLVRQRLASASFITSLSASLSASVALSSTFLSDRKVAASFATALNASFALTGTSDLRGRTVCDLIKESLSLWGFLCAKNAPAYAIERAITDLNKALQMVWNNAQGHDYWSNETLTITLADTESSYNLPDSVQNVVGPCRRSDNKRPLASVRTMAELDTFSALYLDGETVTEPLAYHVDRSKQAGDDPAKCVLHVTPAVSGASVSLLLEVVKEAPRYTPNDLTACPLVPIPHQYTESLLVPIIRYHASSYFLFTATDPEQKKTIEREYQQAAISLGLADPNPAKELEKVGEQ